MENKYDYSIHYKFFHDDSDKHIQVATRGYAEKMKEYLPEPSDDCHVLDIGCGMGYGLLGLRELGFKSIEGIDIDQALVDSCRRKSLPVTWTDDSLGYIKCKKNAYDVIVMMDVLEHIPVDEQIEWMRAVYGCLRLNGRVILTVPNASALFASRWRYIDYTHRCSFTNYSLEFVLKNAGFAKVELATDQILKTRPSLRFWRKNVRTQWLSWLVRRCWKKMLEIEMRWENAHTMSFDLNLTAVAFKNRIS